MTGTTPVFGIPYPDGTTKAYKLGQELRDMGLGMEAALVAAGIPAVTNPDRIVASSDLARNTHFGTPTTDADRLALQRRGAECVRTDKGWTERFFGPYNATTNPSGVNLSGWYPVDGQLPAGKSIGGAGSANTVPSGVATVLSNSALAGTWGGSRQRGGLAFDAAAGTWTVPYTGLYTISAGFGLATSTAGGRQVVVNRNSTDFGQNRLAWSNNPGNAFAAISRQVLLVAGDVLRAFAFHDAGGPLTVRFGDFTTYFDVCYDSAPSGSWGTGA
ncbi:hypothetical protein [Leifsonia aquatica]|uniref:hypothetical protein n=1 Tax=Leifsonia aquatica TaxID=144185 RepID=UPI00381776A4